MGVKVRWNDKAHQFYVYVCYHKRRKAYPAGVNERAAKKLADEKRQYLIRLNLGLPAQPVVPTLASYLEGWLDTVKTRCKTTSLAGYRREIQKHIVPVLGDRPVDSLTAADCKRLIRHWADTHLRTESLRLMLAVLRTALADATAYLPTNPASGLRRECRQPDEIRHEWKPFTRDETVQFLAEAAKGGSSVYPMFLLALRLGMRLGEILALQWGDLDFDGHRIAIQRSMNQSRVITSPKRGRRYADMSDEVENYLKSLPRPEDPTTLVCRTAAGAAYYQHEASRQFHLVRRAAGLRHIRVHDLRHTFASQMLALGAPIHYVSKQLGHSSIKITADIYAHLVPGENRGWASKLTPGSPAGT